MSFLAQIATLGDTAPPAGPDYSKNLAVIPASSGVTRYQAFGSQYMIDANNIFLGYRSGVTHPAQTGSPVTNGEAAGMIYNIPLGTYSAEITVDTETGRDIADTYFFKLRNGNVIMFSSISMIWETTPSVVVSENSYIYFRMGTAYNTLGSRVRVVGGTTGFTEYETGSFFANMQEEEDPDTYGIALWQFNVTTSAYKISLVRTTDSWATWDLHTILTGTGNYTETSVVYNGSGEYYATVRNDQGGKLRGYDSTDNGITWTDRGPTNLGYNGFEERVPHNVRRMDGLVDFWITDRDSGAILYSPDNNPATFMGGATFNPLKLFADIRTSYLVFNGLGYVSVLEISAGVFSIFYSKETSSTNADIWHTLWDKSAPDLAPEPPPTLTQALLSTTYFKIEIEDYTEEEYANIDYFLLDVTSDAGFTTPVSASYEHVQPPVSLSNIRIPAPWFYLTGLTTGTTYYFRVKAVNTAGESAYTTGSVTTT